MTRRVLLVMPSTTYRADAFLAAAARAEVEVVVASDRCHVLDEVWRWPASSLVVDFYEPAAAATTIAAAARDQDVDAIVATEGETPSLVAALAARELGFPHNDPSAARAARDKLEMRELCAAAGVPIPRFTLVPAGDPRGALARTLESVGFPCVLKPRFLSASRGVIRADDPRSFLAAHARIAALLAIPAIREQDPEAATTILVESFVPGPEVALEGMMTSGRLETLAIFDKPDPLDGPLFEETLYVTPSRHPPSIQAAIASTSERAAGALGLTHGPIHAELRIAPSPGGTRPVVIEVAARSIGGLCARVLRFGTGLALEDLILAHALGRPIAAARERRAAGVMMLPIPAAGVLKAVAGVEDARAVPGIEDCVISVRVEEELVPLPEGAAYLGFLFARADTPAEVEAALRAAHAHLRFEIARMLPVIVTAGHA